MGRGSGLCTIHMEKVTVYLSIAHIADLSKFFQLRVKVDVQIICLRDWTLIIVA